MPTGERMTRLDTAWLHMEQPTNRMVVTGLFRFGSPVRDQAVVETRTLGQVATSDAS